MAKLYPELFQYFEDPNEWKLRFLTPELRSKRWNQYVREEIPNIYTVRAFTDEFCDKIIEEANHLIYGHSTDTNTIRPQICY